MWRRRRGRFLRARPSTLPTCGDPRGARREKAHPSWDADKPACGRCRLPVAHRRGTGAIILPSSHATTLYLASAAFRRPSNGVRHPVPGASNGRAVSVEYATLGSDGEQGGASGDVQYRIEVIFLVGLRRQGAPASMAKRPGWHRYEEVDSGLARGRGRPSRRSSAGTLPPAMAVAGLGGLSPTQFTAVTV